MARKLTKKGSLGDLILIATVVFTFAILALIGFKISNELNTEFQASDIIDADGKRVFRNINNLYPGVIDNSFLLFTIGLSIVALVLASLVRVHPVFFIFYFLMLVAVIFIVGVFSNIYLEIANTAEFSAVAAQLTYTPYIMWSLPFIVGIFGFILAIIMYKNWRENN